VDIFEFHRNFARTLFGKRPTFRRNTRAIHVYGRRTIGAAGTYEVAGIPATSATLPAGNTADAIVSTDAGDTETIEIEGHTLADGAFTRVTQQVTLTGQTPAALSIPLARAEQAEVVDGGSPVAGTVSIYDSTVATTAPLGVPDDDNAVVLAIPAASGLLGGTRSDSSAITVPNKYVLYLTGVTALARRNTGAGVNVDLVLQSRPVGGPWRPLDIELSVRSSVNPFVHARQEPWEPIPANHDVRALADVSAACDVAVHWHGYFTWNPR